MSNGLYVLDDNGEPLLMDDLHVWARWLESHKSTTVLAQDMAANEDVVVLISTVFGGVDHNWGEGLPILWETMIFGGPHDGYSERYTSRDEARIGHAEAVAMVRRAR